MYYFKRYYSYIRDDADHFTLSAVLEVNRSNKLDNVLAGAGGRRSLVMRGLFVILTLQPKFLNRVRSYVDL